MGFNSASKGLILKKVEHEVKDFKLILLDQFLLLYLLLQPFPNYF
jgi:hypothetical protein